MMYHELQKQNERFNHLQQVLLEQQKSSQQHDHQFSRLQQTLLDHQNKSSKENLLQSALDAQRCQIEALMKKNEQSASAPSTDSQFLNGPDAPPPPTDSFSDASSTSSNKITKISSAFDTMIRQMIECKMDISNIPHHTKNGKYIFGDNADGNQDDEEDDDEMVHCPIRTEDIFGKTYQTSPSKWKQDDVAFYMYGNQLIIPAEIESVVPLSRFNPVPMYSIRLLDGNGRHTVRHDDLYVLVTDDSRLKQDDDAYQSCLDGADIRSKGINPQLTSSLLWKFNRMNNQSFKASTFSTVTATSSFSNDAIPSIKAFYESIDIALTASNKHGVRYLPNFRELKPSLPIKQQIYPPVSYSSYQAARQHLDFLASLLRQVLTRDDVAAKAPKVQAHLGAIKTGTKDGWEMLEYILRKMVPYLGALGFDPHAQIQLLVVRHGMKLYSFLGQAQSIQETLVLSGVDINPNVLLGQFLSQLMKCANMMPLIAPEQLKFNQFQSTFGQNKIYHDTSVQFLVDSLRQGCPEDTILQLSSGSDHPASPTFSSGISSSGDSLTRPQYAALAPSGSNVDDSVSDSPADESDAIQSFFTADDEDIDDMLKKMVSPVLATLDFDPDNADVRELVYNAMTSHINDSNPVPCEACGSPFHGTDRCRARGFNFLPDWLQRQVKQINSTRGDKPLEPLDQTRPAPRKPAFALKKSPSSRSRSAAPKSADKGRKFGSMECNFASFSLDTDELSLSSCQDDDDNDDGDGGSISSASVDMADQVCWSIDDPNPMPPSSEVNASDCASASSDSTPPTSNMSQSPSVAPALCRISTADDFTQAMDGIASQLESSVGNQQLSIDPQFAVLDMRSYDKSTQSSDPQPDSHDLTSPMHVQDYSAFSYDEQINC